ncbi:MAG: hypothetical protein XU14_C0149G0001 [Armatimonadetes bacterium CSP1-3]|nr:MAG: hypothetical protein XU14_C0149G0001 [Armatimonadetes bacterium CSP1-3]
MGDVIFRAGDHFEEAALREDAFQSMDQITLAARALEKAGFLRRVTDEQGRESYLIIRDITGADLAFVVSREHKEMEEGG